MTVKLDIPVFPPEAEALLSDPRVADLKHEPGFASPERMLEPAAFASRGESPFVLWDYSMEEASAAEVTWSNEPRVSLAWGNGAGFPEAQEQPRFTEARAKPPRLRDAWRYSGWLIASAAFADTIRRFDPEAIATLAIDWRFSDGKALDGYVFLDVRRLVYAYDYARSQVVIRAAKHGHFISKMGLRRALKPDVDTSHHIFRDAADRSSIFMSRALAQALIDLQLREIDFLDPADMHSIRVAG